MEDKQYDWKEIHHRSVQSPRKPLDFNRTFQYNMMLMHAAVCFVYMLYEFIGDRL